ncbi:MAG: D-glycero-alpha-D-manno-heptose-1,7-bisphosphate 7-phosphatase [Burkholderiaceae bacterium]
MNRPAVFLDKDGTVVADVPFNVDPSAIRPARRAREGLQQLANSGLPLFIISNQPGIAFGRFDEDELRGVHRELRRLFADCGATLAGFYYCPHHPDGVRSPYACSCQCRKPEPGLLLGAAREHGLTLRRSWMIGDILDDIEAGNRAGCRTILIDNGGETEWRRAPLRTPTHIVRDLAEAARIVMGTGLALAAFERPREAVR